VSLDRLDIHGAFSGEDPAGHRVDIRFHGRCVTLDWQRTGSVLAALSVMRHSHANGTLAAIRSAARLGLSRIGNWKVELQIRGRTLARAGADARATWLGRTLTRLPIEMHWTDVLSVGWHILVA
jgi:hypothetical protein